MKYQFCPMAAVIAACVMAVVFNPIASARDMVVPAGTILRCTLNEPNFSKATAEIGDPVVCHLQGMTEFGEQAFPRGSYLVGHLESAKDPGHFFGKGNLKLQFDRIGLPGGDMPLEAKIIATRGYKVDKQGEIRGKGHAKRDVAEWMFPPLWPWKVIMLPARGPRPKLKGETTLSLRLMDDVEVSPVTPSYGRPMLQVQPQAFHPPVLEMPTIPAARVSTPRCGQTYGPEWHYFGTPRCAAQSDLAGSTVGPLVQNVPLADESGAVVKASEAAYMARPAVRASEVAPDVPLFVMKNGAEITLGDYSYSDGRIAYTLASGERGVIGWDQVNWAATLRLNTQRGVRVSLHGAPANLSTEPQN
jgi:hypothetical protein